jgi:Tfp pilus assembly protein PilF
MTQACGLWYLSAMGKASRKKKKSSGEIVAGEGSSATLRSPCDTRMSQKAITPARNSKYFLAGVVSLTTFLLYLPSLSNNFLEWDDGDYVTNNPIIRLINLDLIRSAFFEFHAANWHPLTWISHALDYAIWGLNPVGHHLSNVIVHAVNTALVVLVTVRLMELYRERSMTEGGSPWLKEQGILITAGVTGLLFGFHPVHVESVAWVAERKDLLCALFFIMSILAYVKYVSAKSHKTLQNNARLGRFNVSYFLCLVFFMFALLSKPMAISLPFVLLIIDWYPSNRIHSMRSFRSVLIEKLPFFLLSSGSAVLTVLAQKEGGAMELTQTTPLQSRLLVAAHSLFAYPMKMIWPVNLIPFYPYPDNVSLLSLKYLAAVFLVLGISAYCVFAAKKHKLFFSVWSYYVVTLIPVIGIVQTGFQSMADRYTYLPSLGLFILIGLTTARIFGVIHTYKKLAYVAQVISVTVVALVLITLGYLTVSQMFLWKNDFVLWNYAIQVEESALAYFNRGLAYSRMGQFDKAVDDYTRAIALKHSYYIAYLNRGMAFNEMGQFDKAILDFDEAIAIGPRYYEAYNNKGMVYGKMRAFGKAIEQFSKAVDIDSSQPLLYFNRGLDYYLTGETDKALKDLNKAIDLDSNYVDAYGIRGNIYLRYNNKELAISDFGKICNLGVKEGCRVLQTLR